MSLDIEFAKFMKIKPERDLVLHAIYEKEINMNFIGFALQRINKTYYFNI